MIQLDNNTKFNPMAKSHEMRYELFISTGKLNAMYTLRSFRSNGMFAVEHYICNLAATLEKAQAKAQDYFDRLKARIPEWDISLTLDPEWEVGVRRGKLSLKETQWIETIEGGKFPFGKYQGQEIATAPDSYVLFFADKIKDENANTTTQVLASVCLGIALDRDLIAKREAAKEARQEQDMKSNYVGDIGQRLVIKGQIVSSFYKENDYEGWSFYITKIRQGDDLFVYFGNKLGETGENIKLRATVKSHNEYKGIKTTKINRPKVIGE